MSITLSHYYTDFKKVKHTAQRKKREKNTTYSGLPGPGPQHIVVPSKREYLLLVTICVLMVAVLIIAPVALSKQDQYVKGYNHAAEECNRQYGAQHSPTFAGLTFNITEGQT